MEGEREMPGGVGNNPSIWSGIWSYNQERIGKEGKTKKEGKGKKFGRTIKEAANQDS